MASTWPLDSVVYAVKAVNDMYLSVNTEMTTEEKNEMRMKNIICIENHVMRLEHGPTKFFFLKKCFGFKSTTTVSSFYLFIVFDTGFAPYQAYFLISYFIVSLFQMH